MPRQIHEFDPPDRFVAGTVGQPGERTFFLQATDGRPGRSASRWRRCRCRSSPTGSPSCSTRCADAAPMCPRSPPQVPRTSPRSTSPILEEFRVGTMRLAWDGEDDRVVVEAQAQVDGAEVPDETTAMPTTRRTERTCCACDSPSRRLAHSSERALRGRRGRSPAVPALRAAARPGRPHLPAAERPPALSGGGRPRARACPPARRRARRSRGGSSTRPTRRSTALSPTRT